MARRVFLSFHYARDAWRVQQIKNMAALEGQPLLATNRWEEIERSGPTAIGRWIDENMSGRSCVVVLVGANTAARPWVQYEIQKAYEDGRGILGVRIHRLNDRNGRQDIEGRSPFNTTALNQAAVLKSPGGKDGPSVYANIQNNIGAWIEEAIALRGIRG